MPQIELTERVFSAAQRCAAEAGFSSVDEYVADVVSHDPVEESLGAAANLDHLFTPERLAHIDAAEAEIQAGNSYTAEQADAELARRRAEWLRKNPR